MADQQLQSTQNPQPNNGVGRPTVMTDDILGKLRTAFLMGCTDREACSYADINPDTLYVYQSQHPEYTDQKEAWKDRPILEARHTLFDDIKKNPESARWYLERKLKGEFSTRHENVNYDMNAVETLLDKIETNYDDVARKASGQMVETHTPLQDQGQTGEPETVQPEPDATQTSVGEGQPPVQPDSQG